MNLFEDLIGELKDENLIEQTVIETSRAEIDFKMLNDKVIEADTVLAAQTVPPLTESATIKPPASSRAAENSAEVISLDGSRSSNEADFYRKRATEEVAFLQMVEAVMANVEREHSKVEPEPYNELKVKKVLHSFVQVSQDINSPEHMQAHFQLLQETENWHSTLGGRDERVTAAQLRRYCETSRPPLSAPALIALARFYRNSSFSEVVRGKFDLIVTRLFSKEIGNRREMSFSRRDLAVEIAKLYADWSSVPLYSTEKDDLQISRTAGEFEEFIKEADQAESFDELINSNFFNRLRIFKESANEDFYAPLVAAAGIEVNVRVGNRCVELLEKERENGSAAKLAEKHGFTRDEEISEVVGKTLLLTEILKHKAATPKRFVPKPVRDDSASKTETNAVKNESKPQRENGAKALGETENNLFGVNKWLLVATLLAIFISLGLYFGSV
jgi:hypothetical protein